MDSCGFSALVKCKAQVYSDLTMNDRLQGLGVGIHPNKDSPIVSVCGHRTILALLNLTGKQIIESPLTVSIETVKGCFGL